MRLETRRGSNHPESKFEAEEAEALWRRFQSDPCPTLKAVAEELEVAPSTLYRIVHRLSYQK
jgi:DNA-binding MarR family transcriptional regulator